MEKKPKITITTQTYFEDHFYYAGLFLLIVGFPVLFIKWYLGIIALFLGFIVMTTAYKLVIDSEKHSAEDFLFFLGMKRNKVVTTFNKIHHISIKSGTYSQQLNYKSLSSTVHGTMYSAYLMTDEENYFLGESKSQKKITTKAKAVAGQLGLELIELGKE